jgi:hypothetical protein
MTPDDPASEKPSVRVTYRTMKVFNAASASSHRALATRKACRWP